MAEPGLSPGGGVSLRTGLGSPCRPHRSGEGASQSGGVGFPGTVCASLVVGGGEGDRVRQSRGTGVPAMSI